MSRSRSIQLFVGFSISLAAIVWLYFSINWVEVGSALSRAHYWVLLPSTFILFVHFYLKAVRWKYLLPLAADASLRVRFDSIMIGSLANFVLPLRLGEFVRPALLAMKSNADFSSGLVSVVIERFFDLFSVLLCFGAVVILVPDIPTIVYQGAVALSILAILILAYMLAGVFVPESLKKASNFFASFLPGKVKGGAVSFLNSFLLGSRILRERGVLVKVAAYSILIWATNFLFFYLFFFMFDIQGTFIMAVGVSVILALAVAAPSAPGFVGVYQGACVAAFALFSVSQETAAAYSVVSHLLQYVIYISYGLFALAGYGLTLSDLKSTAVRPS